MRYRILLVDDERNLLQAVVRALRKEPYEFLTAQSADEALGVLSQGPVDVVISDERMPGMGGTDFLATVREHHPHTVRMMLTASAEVKTAERALEKGAVFRYFLKPFDPVELGKAIYEGILLRALAWEEDGLRLLMPMHMQDELLARLGAEKSEDTPAGREASNRIGETSLYSHVHEVVAHLKQRLERSHTKEEVIEVFADIRTLLARVQTASQRDEIVEIFREVWNRIEPRVNR